MSDFYVDIHCHSTMRACHSETENGTIDIWNSTVNETINTFSGRFAEKNSKRILKSSQSNFYNCAQGNVKVVFDSLYPLEQGFYNYRKQAKIIIGKNRMDNILSVSSGVTKKKIHAYRSNMDYFEELINQYDFLVKNQGASPCNKYTYKVVNNYGELSEAIANQPNQLNVIITIEGCHALGLGTKATESTSIDDLKEKISDRIKEIKNWKYPPFFVTFAHHFWNQLCGHARTFPVETKFLLNQEKGIDTGFTEIGIHAMRELLATKNGRRILIDTRHMSGKSRAQYAAFIAEHNKQNPEDKIPFITSHSGISGEKTFQTKSKNKSSKNSESKNFYSKNINVSAEEAKAINESGGIMGLILDKGRLCNPKILKRIHKIENKSVRKDMFLKMIWDNLFFFVAAINHKSGWDNLTLGTDFDGVITHIDFYPNMSTLPDLRNDLLDYLVKHKYNQELWHGYEPEELVHKVFTQNAMDFLQKHFN